MDTINPPYPPYQGATGEYFTSAPHLRRGQGCDTLTTSAPPYKSDKEGNANFLMCGIQRHNTSYKSPVLHIKNSASRIKLVVNIKQKVNIDKLNI